VKGATLYRGQTRPPPLDRPNPGGRLGSLRPTLPLWCWGVRLPPAPPNPENVAPATVSRPPSTNFSPRRHHCRPAHCGEGPVRLGDRAWNGSFSRRRAPSEILPAVSFLAEASLNHHTWWLAARPPDALFGAP